ncbi:hypothetical protein BJF92_10525 [Rhizobium rhizosphaerae]|uniref:Uncharacterized protein n=1 Tax=Xaviernesmea rhizosphaerae TaxID=1672749 RepID=A0A1Q9AMF5_9HYPH|nr:hypothetical protein BJF92_10525 [Xaviernesmea rhizosphaerae]
MQEETAPLPIPAPPPLVHNERVKLTAAAIDRLSTACVAAGFISPVVSLANGQIMISAFSLPIALSTMTWLFTALILDFAARRVLGKLRP